MSQTLRLPNRETSKQFASAPLFQETATNKLLDALTSIPDPDQVLTKAGLSRCELRKMEGDDEVTAASDTRCEAVVATPWHLEGGDGQPANDANSVFIWEAIEPWVEAMARAAWAAVPYGYSVWETVYARNAEGGRIGILKIEEKPFEWFRSVRGVGWRYFPVDKPQGEDVDPRKFFFTVRQPTYLNPYGKALYSRLYWAWFFRTQGWRFWMQHLERWGIPFMIGHTSGNADAMAKQLAKMVKNATAAIGMDDKVEVVQATGAAHFEMFERAVCSRVQKVILGQTLTTDAGGSTGKSGSYALGQVHNEVRQDRRNADIRLIARTIQRQINTLWQINAFGDKAPLFKFQDDTGLQMDRAERDSKLLGTGKVKLSKEYFERAYDYEPGEVEVVEGQPVDQQQGDKTGKKGELKAARDAQRFTDEQQAVEDLIEASLKQLGAPVDGAAIKNAIKAARDPDDLVQRLSIILGETDRIAFARVVERCLFAADVMGYAHAGA